MRDTPDPTPPTLFDPPTEWEDWPITAAVRAATLLEPAYATARNLERPTIGAEVAAVAALIGHPLIPWQRELVDIAGELEPGGRLARRYVVAIVPRRAGKTLAMLALRAHPHPPAPWRSSVLRQPSGHHR